MSILYSVGAGKRLVGTRVIDMFYALTKISDFIKQYNDNAPVDDAGTKCFCYCIYFEVKIKNEVAEKEKPTTFTILYGKKAARQFIVDVQQKITSAYEHKKNEIILKHINNKQFGTKFDIDTELKKLRFEEILKTLKETIHTTLLKHCIKTSDIEYISIMNVDTNITENGKEYRVDIPVDYTLYRDYKLKEMYPADDYQQIINSYSYICL